VGAVHVITRKIMKKDVNRMKKDWKSNALKL
jgi:hypothetical protein